jgi:hypothetical protein
VREEDGCIGIGVLYGISIELAITFLIFIGWRMI